MIEVNDLHKKFGKVKVLNGIHLEYHPGKIYGLVGENGAGKTTLFFLGADYAENADSFLKFFP